MVGFSSTTTVFSSELNKPPTISSSFQHHQQSQPNLQQQQQLNNGNTAALFFPNGAGASAAKSVTNGHFGNGTLVAGGKNGENGHHFFTNGGCGASYNNIPTTATTTANKWGQQLQQISSLSSSFVVNGAEGRLRPKISVGSSAAQPVSILRNNNHQQQQVSNFCPNNGVSGQPQNGGGMVAHHQTATLLKQQKKSADGCEAGGPHHHHNNNNLQQQFQNENEDLNAEGGGRALNESAFFSQNVTATGGKQEENINGGHEQEHAHGNAKNWGLQQQQQQNELQSRSGELFPVASKSNEDVHANFNGPVQHQQVKIMPGGGRDGKTPPHYYPHQHNPVPSAATITGLNAWNHSGLVAQQTAQNGPNLNSKNSTKSRHHYRSTSANATSTHQRLAPLMKLVVIGLGGVGKSAITIQFVQQYFILDYDPTIADTYQKNMFLEGDLVRLEIYDTAGQDEFATMRDQSLREANGFLLVFSVTSRESLDYVCRLQRYIEVFKDRDFFPMILVGNKCDLDVQRQISKAEVEQLARSWGVPYFECSAKYHKTITQIFEELVRLVRVFQFKEKHCNGSVPWLNGIGGAPTAAICDRPDGVLVKAKKKRKNCPIQ